MFSSSLLKLFEEAWIVSSVELGQSQIRSAAILAALAENPLRYGAGFLEAMDKISLRDIADNFESLVEVSIEQTEAVTASVEEQIASLMGSDLVVATARIGLKDPQAFDATRGSAENEALITAILPNLNKQRSSAEWLEVFRR